MSNPAEGSFFYPLRDLLALLVMPFSDLYEDAAHFVPQSGPVGGEDGTFRVKDDVDAVRQCVKVSGDGRAHTPLDAIALDRLAQNLAGGDADARGHVPTYARELCRLRRDEVGQ